MEFLCRLCAVAKEPDEIRYSINDAVEDIERKLISCCDWNSYRCHADLPKSVCYSCYLLLEQCFNFQSSVSRAQKKLLKQVLGLELAQSGIFNRTDHSITNSITNAAGKDVEGIEVSGIENHPSDNKLAECNESRNHTESDIEQNGRAGRRCDPISNEQDSDYGDYDRDYSEDDQEITIGGNEFKDYSGNESRPEQSIQLKVAQRKTTAKILNQTFDIAKCVSAKDVNKDGTIKEEIIRRHGVTKWEAIIINCPGCKDFADDHTKLKKHFIGMHPGEMLAFLCPYCEKSERFLSGRYWRFHIVKEHFEHLAYW